MPPVNSIPLATARARLEEERARMRQDWQEYQESFFEDARSQLYVRSVYGQLHGHRGRFDGRQSDNGALTRTPR